MEWKIIIDGLFNLLNVFKSDREHSNGEKDLALTAIISATNETKIYIQKVQKTGKTDRSTEETLSRMWAAASIPLRHFDRDLAQRCLEKSDYWLNPDNYSAPEIAQLRIGIEQVYKDAKKLL